MLRTFEELRVSPDAFGYEHEVWFPRHEQESPHVLKATYANCVICSDTHGGNILVAGGDMVAIDIPVIIAPEDFV